MKRFLKDRRGIEGLPMKLIIIVVIAGVVLAALTALMGFFNPKGTMQISYNGIEAGNNVVEDTSGFLVKVDAQDEGQGKVEDIDFTAHVYVNETTEKKEGIPGVQVTITGGGGAGAGTTDGNGLAEVEVTGCTLPAGPDTLHLEVKAKKSGYHDEVDKQGIQLQRIT